MFESHSTIHPGVAEAGRAEAGDDFQAAVGAELAAFWRAVFGVVKVIRVPRWSFPHLAGIMFLPS
jgi:hypothetical protein